MTRPMWLVMLLAGALPVLAFPRPGLAALAWVALAPGLVLLVRAATTRVAVRRAWQFGAGYLLAALYWLAPEIGPGLLLVAGVFGAMWVPYGIAARALLRPPVRWPRALAALAVLPSCWLITERIRSWQALGGPWALYGATQWRHPAQLALAALGGVWLLTAVLVLVNTAIVLILGAVRPAVLGAPDAPRSWRPVAVALPLLVVGAAAGPVAFAHIADVHPDRRVTLALVQPGILHTSAAQSDASRALTAARSGAGTLDGARPDLIVWGESSVLNRDLGGDPALLRSIESLAGRTGADLLVNQDFADPGTGKQKAAVLVGPDGILDTYAKTRLVPFGEYIPLRKQFGWLTSISHAASIDTRTGPGARLLTVPDRDGRPLPIGVLICFESAFPDMSRVDADLGAQLLVYQSSTSTFQGSWGPDQHAALAAVRAAETGRPAVQAAMTGVSDAFDARGRELLWLDQDRRDIATVRLELPPAAARTPFDRYGDYVWWIAAAVDIAAVAAVVLARRRTGVLLSPSR
jgi:apolipoprotein N-acyltransferase